ncbi:membrane protein hemolysin iii protein [Agrilactobacillus composti DSM 18527 = JCM 14202]|uniref:Membrane protein hemolysin iii protein n=1 Tax=Agrilactobacillus composti DSM 18527 = JCM 14202 TaxID=1423734 RepID=A0A0R1Y2J4_9LACO|nr:hemolysin III family protein [Agrilactobacillus composti]KRM36544.1 membrane protein hemolysin iii protein [Agrilactobacillus composti DSM 18527 = JCM 14202]
MRQSIFNERPHLSKKYEITNEVLNAVTHGLAVFLAITGLVILLLKGLREHSTLAIVSYAIYGASMIILYLSSTLFHSLIFTRAKHVFQIFDHSSIFLLIAGTYTPYCLLAIQGTFGWVLCGVIWLLAISGILYKIFNVGAHRGLETCLYVLMGWGVLIAMHPLYLTLGWQGLWLLILGGVAFTLGAVIYSMRAIPFIHVIWHLFVILGSALMYFSILFYI